MIFRTIFFFIVGLLIIFSFSFKSVADTVLTKNDLNISQVKDSLEKYASTNEFPSHLDLPSHGQVAIDYTFDVGLHNHIASIYRSYKPDYAAFVAIDPETGRILSLTSYVKDQSYGQNFALGSSYPAASLFKMVSAAAAIDANLVSTKTVLPFNGKSTTLYKSQVLRHKDNKYTRRLPLSEAFARSSNPFFGRLGVEYLSDDLIFEYAKKMGFGVQLAQDLPIEPSSLDMSLSDEWQRAEAASGFTKDIQLSPVHAASIAAAIVNGGVLYEPYIVDQIRDVNGSVLLKGNSVVSRQMFSKETAQAMKYMMRETARIGSAKKSFSSHRRYKAFKGAEFGGKTGSLSGHDPEGRYGWFAGYGERNGKQIAYASLVVYKEKWVVRAARVAFEVLNYVFKQPV
jgi:cell division protein FtsI/penicillin-binding protein 2